MRKSLGFTLAEVLITLAIIGVVAAMTIPSVIVNTNQQEFKTGLKKAISVLNQAITMSIALESVGPNDSGSGTGYNSFGDANSPLRGFFAQRLNVIKKVDNYNGGSNYAFYTADGMRFEFPGSTGFTSGQKTYKPFGCGDGQNVTPGHTAKQEPCEIVVDVNGDKKPNPIKVNDNNYSVPAGTDSRISDVFNIAITDTAAIPLGMVAQRTMYQSD